MIFKNLFKPKWQHKNPQTRKQALLALNANGASERDIWQYVATNDAEPELRRLAVKNVHDTTLLRSIADGDSDATVKDQARQKLQRILAGVLPESPSIAERKQLLADLNDNDIIEYIAVYGVETELRIAAIDRISREALLGDIAIQDSDSQTRLHAIEKVTQKSTLERVLKQTRTKDKRVSRLAKDRLTAMEEAAARPARIREECEALCLQIDDLCSSTNWDRAELQLDRLKTQWDLIAAEAPAEWAERFKLNLEKFTASKKESIERVMHAEQHRLNALRALKEEICQSLENLVTDVESRSAIGDAEDAAINGILRTSQNGWQNSDSLDIDEESHYQQRFDAAFSRVEKRRSELRASEKTAHELSDLKQQAAALAKAKPNTGTTKRLQELEQHLTELPIDDNETRELIVGLKNKAEQEQRKKELLRAELLQCAEALESALDTGKIAATTGLLRKSRRLLKQIPSSADKLFDPARKRIQAAEARIRELRDWQGWANKPEKERLCEEIEALIGSDHDPRELAQTIKEAQDEWKQLGPADPAVAEQLWERFKAATDKAYEPCRVYFAQQAAERIANLAQRLALCEEIEQFVASSDWSQVNWKLAAKFEQQAQLRWRTIGQVDRKDFVTANERYVAALKPLQEQIRAERDRNQASKQRLVSEVEMLITATDLRAAINQAKLAQPAWKAIGAGHRKTDQELWIKFRAACDALFSRLREGVESEQKERQENLEKKQALCAEVESLTQLDGDALQQAVGKVKQAEVSWKEIGMVPKENAKESADQFRLVCKAFFDKLRSLKQDRERQLLNVATEKDRLCSALENKALTQALTAVDQSEVETVWKSLASLPQQIEHAMGTRLRAISDVITGKTTVESMQQRLIAQTQLALTHCLRLEITANIESPAEFQEARMAYQVSRLSSEMGQGGEQDAARSENKSQVIGDVMYYYTLGPIDPSTKARCDERVQQVKTKLGLG